MNNKNDEYVVYDDDTDEESNELSDTSTRRKEFEEIKGVQNRSETKKTSFV
ncbi:hypothetical protein RirG_194520 [Rhizophagus irregularis DAOM 197198w]|uniref:Uncharacterized protein n=1 Tax=Rhizophagus irregularis (strain DAOM 197198w) TaxID=1432141 RepID=A0A015JUN3_RHIIW|nr:hypothetical protein RirG_194520 [Rhizophagus irregularis DAOM 197198w]